MANILSLTYHEVTRDPRVFKQAKALAAAGHNVVVVSAQLGNMRSEDVIDGVQIIRLNLFDEAKDLHHRMEDLFYLERSKTEITDLVEGVRDARLVYDAWPTRRIAAREDLTIKITPMERLYQMTWGLVQRKFDKRTLRHSKRSLYQAKGIYMDINLRRVDFGFIPDIVHTHDLYTVPAGIALSKKFDARLVYDAHELEFARAIDMPTANRDMIDRFEKDCLDHVDAVVTVSESYCDEYEKRHAHRRPTLVMNVPEPKPIGMHSADIRDLVGLPAETKVMVFTGNVFGKQRGLDKVVDAMVHLPDLHLMILGPRHKRNDRALLKLAKKAGVEARVHMHASVPAEMVVDTIRSSDLGVCLIQDVTLSYRYAMPNKLFESAHAGLPLVVSDLPELKRFVEELGCGLVVDETDPKAIAAGIQKVLDDRDAYLLSSKAKEALQTKYSWKAQVASLLALYDDLLHEQNLQIGAAE